MIRDVRTKLVIALKDGKLGLYPQDKKKNRSGKGGCSNHGRGSHWHCIENKGMWLGFQMRFRAGLSGIIMIRVIGDLTARGSS